MKKIALILLLGVVVAFATAPTLVAPEGVEGIFHAPFVGAIFPQLLYDNNIPMDASTYAGIGSAQNDTGTGMDSRLADDFSANKIWTIEGVEFLGGEWGGTTGFWVDWTGMDIDIFADDGGSPANPPDYPLHTEHVLWENITSSTVVYQGSDSAIVSHIVTYLINGYTLHRGNYWFSIWPYLDRGAGDPQTGMMLSNGTTGSEIYFSSDYFGFPDWVTWDSVTGNGPQDLAFRIYGVFNGAIEETTWGQIKAAF